MNRVGLFFGSFDPPHIGHVNVVAGVINSGLVDQVLVIPAYQNICPIQVCYVLYGIRQPS